MSRHVMWSKSNTLLGKQEPVLKFHMRNFTNNYAFHQCFKKPCLRF